MKAKGFIIIVCCLFFILSSGCNKMNADVENVTAQEETQLSQQEKLDDFEYMYTIMKENYPFFEVNKRLHGIDWLQNKEQYIDLVKASKNDEDFLDAMQKIMMDLHNGHTHMVSFPDYYFYKQLVKDNKVLFEHLNSEKSILRYKEWEAPMKEALKKRYAENNNIRTEILQRDKTAYLGINSFIDLTLEDDMKVIEPFLRSISNYEALIIDIRGNGGGSDSYWKEYLVPMLINEPVKYVYYSLYRGGDFAEEYVKSKYGSGKLGYKDLMQIKYIGYEELEKIPPEAIKDFKYYFKNRTSIYPDNSIGFKGKIYLLVDQKVFSASEGFAVFAKNTGFATLVGQTTGGDGIGIDPFFCALPNSGYVFRFSSVMGLAADGTCNEEFKTKPDIEIIAEKNENLYEDKVVQYVLEQVK